MLLLFSLFFLFLLLGFPSICLQGAKNGLLLWFEVVLPTLFPFMTLSLFMVKTGISHHISRLCPTWLCRILGVSREGVYPVFIGMLSGYPVGAKNTAALYDKGLLSRQESGYLLCLCNNISPMFLLSFIGGHCLNLGKTSYILLPILYLSSFLAARLLMPLWKMPTKDSLSEKKTAGPEARIKDAGKSDILYSSWIAALNAALMEALHTLAFVGGYIILFSLLGNVLLCILPESISGFCTALLEITTGASCLRASTFYTPEQKIILLSTLSSFGGLSSIAQTGSVITESGLSLYRYGIGKLLQAMISAILTVLLFFVIGNFR